MKIKMFATFCTGETVEEEQELPKDWEQMSKEERQDYLEELGYTFRDSCCTDFGAYIE